MSWARSHMSPLPSVCHASSGLYNPDLASFPALISRGSATLTLKQIQSAKDLLPAWQREKVGGFLKPLLKLAVDSEGFVLSKWVRHHRTGDTGASCHTGKCHAGFISVTVRSGVQLRRIRIEFKNSFQSEIASLNTKKEYLKNFNIFIHWNKALIQLTCVRWKAKLTKLTKT